MPDFNVRSDSVNVEQIMEQIRARIREKRGVDYTEQQIHELAAVKLEKFLDPRGVRSDLLDQFKARQPRHEPPVEPSLVFEDTTMFETHRVALRFMRSLLGPILKLFFNPNALIHALHTQAEINKAGLAREAALASQRRDIDGLYFEVIHNLVVEVTRTGIEVKNLKMRVESLASRLEFNERRARALESAVVYRPSNDEPPPRPSSPPEPAYRPRPSQPPPRPSQPVYSAPPSPSVAGPSMPPAAPGGMTSPGQNPLPGAGLAGEGPGQRSRRRRRRRGRRTGGPAAAIMGAPGGAPPGALVDAPGSTDENGPDDGGSDEVDNGSDVGESRHAAQTLTTNVEHAPPVEHAPSAEHNRPADPVKPEPDPQ